MTSGDDHQVLQFRPRGRRASFVPKSGPNTQISEDLPADLSRYESGDDEPDDFRHRMITNAFAFGAAIILIAIGVWLAMAMTDLRKKEDCVLMARRDCSTVTSH